MPHTWLGAHQPDAMIDSRLAVVRIPLPLANDVGNDIDTLNDDDRATANQLAGTPRWPMFVRTRAALRQLAGAFAGKTPDRITITKDKKGRFHINDLTSHSFSLSHAGKWLVIGWSQEGTIGVDIEPFPDTGRLPGLIKQCLNNDEAKALNILLTNERVRAFASMWTAKEAFGKAIGSGVMPTPKLMYAKLGEDQSIAEFSAPGSSDFCVTSTPEIEDHAGAVAHTAPARQIDYFVAEPGGMWPPHWFIPNGT